jgi:putative transposase
MPDHIHVFFGLKPSMRISDLVRDIKNNSTNFINDKKWVNGIFQWQEGYGAFSHSQSEVRRVFDYIRNQEEHHRNVSFRKEYIRTLNDFKILHDEKYLFEWIDDEA